MSVATRAMPGADSTSPERPRWRPTWVKLLPLCGPLALVAVWWGICASGTIRPVLLPTPTAVFAHLWDASVGGSLAADTWITLSRTLAAFAIAAVVGIPLGVALGSDERLYRSIEFVVDFFRSTPASALIPLFILFFGISDFNKIAIAAFAALLIVLFNSAYGIMHARRSRIVAAKVMGANSLQIFRDVLMMETLPQTFVGLRNGISTALVIVVVAEMFVGSAGGLGYRIIQGEQLLQVTDMYASILVAGILGYALNMIFMLVDKRFIHWSGK